MLVVARTYLYLWNWDGLEILTVGSCLKKNVCVCAYVCVLIFIFLIFILKFTGGIVCISKALQEKQNTCIF